MPQSNEPVLTDEPAFLLTTVGPWVGAFLARACAGDDLLDELRALDAPAQIVDADSGECTTWLEAAAAATAISIRLPAPGDPAGLPPGPAGSAAAHVGEALVLADEHGPRVIVPTRGPDEPTSWVAHRVPLVPEQPTTGLGEARATLLESMGEATAALAALPGSSDGDPATLRGDLARRVTRYSPVFPPGVDGRAVDVAGLAAQVLGTLDLARARRASFGLATADAQHSEATLREVSAAAHGALATAVNRVVDDYTRR
ncbi:hypothetical protein [Gordonia sp. (in: high G+C Gram-positive bacteria)]|uniref:hypothetical protein n=1 Tax=Gordonia sp. (in: high G+C Gram-positive bacteria) TaxID=84139 RepID=UPI0039E52194